MAGIFIAGNGFDIAHGIPTKYSEFRKYIISRYPDALKFRDAKLVWRNWNMFQQKNLQQKFF